MADNIDNSRPRATVVLDLMRTLAPGLIAGLALATVATVAGIVSYTHIDALTLSLGGSRLAGHLMPLGVDGQIVMGSTVLLTAAGRAAWWGWLGIGLGLAESLFANWESGISHGPLAAGWAMVAALSFAVASFSFERWLKSLVTRAAGVVSPNVSSTSDGDGSDKPNPCPHSLAMTAEEGLVHAFLHIRDCLWQEPSQRKLSAAFGISRPRVAELVAPYLPEDSPGTPEPSLNGTAPGA